MVLMCFNIFILYLNLCHVETQQSTIARCIYDVRADERSARCEKNMARALLNTVRNIEKLIYFVIIFNNERDFFFCFSLSLGCGWRFGVFLGIRCNYRCKIQSHI